MAAIEKESIPPINMTEKVSSSEENLTGIEWDDKDEKRIRQRMDFRIVPTVFVLYLLCFIDRANIGNARIQGMGPELKLNGNYRFNWALTILYFSYIAVEIPSNILLKKIGGRFYIPSLVIAFGLVSMCTAFIEDFRGLYACRFFLGLAEGGMLPGISYYLSCFYKRNELLFRMGIYITGSSLAGAFGGLLAAGLTQIPEWGTDSRKIHNWRNIFFFEGIFTLIIAGIGMLILPSSPDQSKFLTTRDQYIALERINREHKESANEPTTLEHVKRGIFNINNLICALGFFSINISVQSFSLFLPTILVNLGWKALKTQFYSVPPYVVACLFSIFIARMSDVYKRRGIFIIGGTSLSMIGYIMLVTVETDSLKYFAVFLAAAGVFPQGPAFLAWGLNNAAGPSVRAVSGAYIVALGSGGAIIATWTYLDKDKPKFHRGHYINIGAQVVALSMACIGIAYNKWENGKRERGERDSRIAGMNEQEKIALGYRNPEFRYQT
ncbi:related to permease of the major facilitator superfamily [Rhynchosporium agropyri]|uniref:Related to permease of the major facilitator superfamily n=1 Tax=Rhynchosporium agropyri TaxID=914238 RepID=A0A1E1JUR5_9HELO|nr:related to permease of the major facilitator superfamily [Rhynchosporium agropyri]